MEKHAGASGETAGEAIDEVLGGVDECSGCESRA